VQGAGFDAIPVVSTTRSVGDEIVRVAAERSPDLVLMSHRKPFFGGRLLGGSLGQVLRDAPSDVAILVDPASKGTALPKDAEILVPYGHGFHEDAGLDLALRLAKTAGGTVHLVGAGTDAAAHDLAAVAATAYERSGVWTTADPVTGDVVGPLVRATNDADLVVLAVSETWADEGRVSLGRVREIVAGNTTTPLLVVRRHGQEARRGPRRWFGRRAEWMEDTGEIDLRDGSPASVAEQEAELTQ
jgi:nucleotide-binding universal stress UspA family protein